MKTSAAILVMALVVLSSCAETSNTSNTGPAPTCSSYVNCTGLCKHDADIATIALLWQAVGQPGFAQFRSGLDQAVEILNEIQSEGVVSENRLIPHVSFQYLCCLSLEQNMAAARAMRTVEWSPVNIRFDRIICNQDRGGLATTVSFVALVDQAGQQELQQLVERFEDAERGAGVPIPRPRSQQEPFHATIGVVNEGFPVEEALARFATELPSPLTADPIRIESFLMFIPPERFHSQ